jgi:hypothetical protein
MASAAGVSLTPAYAQYPPCGYTLTEAITWNVNGAPINVISDYVIQISSTNVADHGLYNVVQTNTISYTDDGLGLQNWVETTAFNVDIRDPCKTSVFSAVSLTDMTVIVG